MRWQHLISILLLPLIYEPVLFEELRVAIIGAGTMKLRAYSFLLKREYIHSRYRRNICGILSFPRSQKCEDYSI